MVGESVTHGATCVWTSIKHSDAHLHHLGLHLTDVREEVAMQRVSPREHTVYLVMETEAMIC